MPSTPRAVSSATMPLLLALALCACSSSSVAGSSGASTAAPSLAAGGPPPGGTAPASAAPAATTLASCGPARDLRSLHAVHHFSVSPDDIAVDPAGRLWITARQAGLLVGMTDAGTSVSVRPVGGGPEGVVSDGATLYVAQQDRDAIVVVEASPRTLLAIPNRTGNLGIDGLGFDATRHHLLVPDSPSGRLLAVSLGGLPAVQVLAGALGRPVAAATDPLGDVFVASESSPALRVVTPSGTVRPLGHFTDLDEVVWYSGLLYVTELDRHDVVAVDPGSGAAVVVAAGLPAPQGLAVTVAGVLEIVDSTTSTLYSTPACGVAA